MRRRLLLVVLVILVAAGVSCQADVPRIVYDAAATDASGSQVPDGIHQATFRVYAEPVGGSQTWSETIDRLDVANGRFHVELGRVNSLSLDWSRPYYISIQFDSGGETAQRTQLYRSDSRTPLSSASSDLAYLAADQPLYEPTQSGIPVGAVPGGNWGTDIGSYQGVSAYSNGADTGSWSSLEPIGTDGYQYQCVELCRRFYRVHLGMATSGWASANGNQFYGYGSGWGLEQHANGSGLPQPEDILCLDGGSWGHVAIVISATSSAVNVLQENCSTSTGFGTYTVSNGTILWTYGTCQGWLHKPGNNDTTPPVISSVQATGISSNEAGISWTTDDSSTSRVDYGLTNSYGQSTTEDSNLVTSHSVGLSGLSSRTLYHYRVKSTNGASLTTYSGDYTFTTTTATPGQPTVAQIDSTTLSVANNASDSGTDYFAFRINDGSTCSNKFVQSGGTVGASPVWQTKSTWGTRTVTGLTPGTSYTFDVAAASDASGSNPTSNLYAGTYVNSPTLGTSNKWGSGDTAATFNGSSQYVTLPAMGAGVDLSTGFTIECWANPTAWALADPVLQLKTTASDGWSNHICFDMTGAGVMRAEVYDASGSAGSGNYYYSSDSTNCVFTKNEWHHYAVVVKSDKSLIWYKDGTAYTGTTRGSDSAAVTAVTILPASGVTRDVVQIARRYTTGAYWWTGSLDEVAVYNYALSSTRITAHKNAADAALYNTAVITDNPIAYWRMGEASGTAAADNKGGYSTGQTKYTLAKAGESTDGTGSTGNVYTTASKNTWYGSGKSFTFSNPAGFGTGGTWKASSFEYKWNKSSTETWATSGTPWNSGTISFTATSGDGDYYLHVRAFNGDGVANNTDDLHYGPFRSDATAPSTVTVTDEGSYTPSQSQLKASWTASSDSGSGLNRYEYAVGTSSSTQNIKGWTTNGTSTSVTITGLSLADGSTYYVQARAVDAVENTSSGAAANGILAAPGVTPISSAWSKSNDTQPLSLRDKIVTAQIGGTFWLEETNRTSAIRVVSGTSVAKGNTVSVAGVLRGDGTSRYLLGDVVINSGGNTVIQPLGVTCKWLGGGSYNTPTPGITGGVGQYNIGMLVRCWGNVTYYDTADAGNKYFYLNDGSGLASGGHDGVKVWCGSVNPPTGGTVIVSGVISSELIGGKIVPIVMIRDGGDIQTP